MPERNAGALGMVESLAPDIAAPLKRLTADLVRVAGANLAGLILHNDRAPGRRRSRNRVIKVVVLLHDASATALADVEPVFENAWQLTGCTTRFVRQPCDRDAARFASLADLARSDRADCGR
jgi:hypothetical protein